MSRRKLFIAAAIVIIMVLLSLYRQGKRGVGIDANFSVIGAETLFAAMHRGPYQTGSNLFVSRDAGISWQPVQIRGKAVRLTGNDKIIYLLTKKRVYYSSASNGFHWKPLDFVNKITAKEKYLYDIDYDGGSRLLICTDSTLLEFDTQTHTVVRYSVRLPKIDAVSYGFLSRINRLTNFENKIIISGNPFVNYIDDPVEKKLIPWNNGIAPSVGGLHGTNGVIDLSDRYILCAHDGLYTSEKTGGDWKRFRKAKLIAGLPLGGPLNRAIITTPWNKNQWLLATDEGIFLMENETELKMLWEDDYPGSGYGLVGSMVCLGDAVLASFIYSSENVIGVKIKNQGKSAELIQAAI